MGEPTVRSVTTTSRAALQRRSSRRLRVAVSGSELFAGRIVLLLNSMGVDARKAMRVSGGRDLRLRLGRWRHGLSADVSLCVYGTEKLTKLQQRLAKLGVPTVFLWIGTDVLGQAPEASKAVAQEAWHWCVSPWLRDELAGMGIEARVVPLTSPEIPEPMPPLPERFSVLAYIPEARRDFYGLDFVIALALRRPDVPFRLLATRSLSQMPDNVEQLGWVDDMGAVMAGTTVYIRPTKHDGLSNIVLEALAWGRYVLWSYPYPGVETATTVDMADAWLTALERKHMQGQLVPNLMGREVVKDRFDPAIVRHETMWELRNVAKKGWRTPPPRVLRLLARLFRGTLRSILRSDRAFASQKSPGRAQ